MSHDPEMRTPNRINAFLSPAYWGSLAAFLLTMAGTIALGVLNGPPEYLFPLPEMPGTELLVFAAAVVIVTAYVVRYYSAVAVQLFGLSEHSLFNCPTGFRKALFWLLSSLILLAGLNTFLVGMVGVVPALAVCLLQSTAAILALGGIWTGKQFRPDLFEDASVPFSGTEVFFAAAVGYLLYILMTAGAAGSDAHALFIGAAIAWTAWFTLHEWMHRYAVTVRRQFTELQKQLDE